MGVAMNVRYLSVEEVAESLGMKPVTVRKWIDHPDPKKRLKAYYWGRQVRVKETDLAEFMERRSNFPDDEG